MVGISSTISGVFLHSFVHEHNLIDPQPGHLNSPGDPHYDDHLNAAAYVVKLSTLGKRVEPRNIHRRLMRRLKGFEKEAGRFRRWDVQVGGHTCPYWERVPTLLRLWTITLKDIPRIALLTEEERRAWVWRTHVEYEHIHPFSDGNGRSGRLLMLNHALLVGLEPWYVPYADRYAYYDLFGG